MVFASLLLLVLNSSVVRHESCDMIELHHMHDANGNKLYEQIILWDWDEQDSKYHVRAWRILQSGERPEKRNGRYYIAWNDNRIERCFISSNYKESWLQRDPERDDKIDFPECCRVALRR